VKILHGCHGREYRLSALPHYSVDDFYPETRTVYEFFGCYYNGHKCQTYPDFTTIMGLRNVLVYWNVGE